MTPTGQTADGRWELGVRRTLPITPQAAWALVRAPDGLGPLVGDAPVRSETPGEVVRFAWREDGWERDATLQIRVLPAATGTTIAIHQEGLPSEAARTELLERWTAALDALREI